MYIYIYIVIYVFWNDLDLKDLKKKCLFVVVVVVVDFSPSVGCNNFNELVSRKKCKYLTKFWLYRLNTSRSRDS
jgi:hypothetical protein